MQICVKLNTRKGQRHRPGIYPHYIYYFVASLALERNIINEFWTFHIWMVRCYVEVNYMEEVDLSWHQAVVQLWSKHPLNKLFFLYLWWGVNDKQVGDILNPIPDWPWSFHRSFSTTWVRHKLTDLHTKFSSLPIWFEHSSHF